MTKHRTITFLIGNGLGKAINPGHFDLKQGMKTGWKNTRSRKIKSLITKFLCKAKPTSEKDLEKIQDCFLKLQSIEHQIKGLPRALKNTLENYINKDKEKFYNYLFNVSSHFYHYNLETTKPEILFKFNCFINNFCSYLIARKTNGDNVHIATLNYDGLLYKSFIDKKDKIFNGYSGCLVDGITNSGFNKNNLQQKMGKTFGWYLHLHGSPLFYSENSRIKKNNYNKSTSAFDTVKYKHGRKHIILCHPKQKYETIQYSEILKEYLEHFKVAISHSDCLVMLGYGGEDSYINEIIKNFLKDEGVVLVIERSAEGLHTERSIFWKERLCTEKTKFKLVQKESILDFNFDCATHKTTAS